MNLRPDGQPISIDGVTLRTPGLQGEANAHRSGLRDSRAASGTTESLESALEQQGISQLKSIEIAKAREVPAAAVTRTRGTRFDEPAIELAVPAPSPGWGQMVMAIDEAGVVTWQFAPSGDEQRGDARRSTSGMRTYLIPRLPAPAPPPGVAASRNLATALGKKILKVLVFKLLDPVAAAAGHYFAGRWEAAQRPYHLRTFTPDDYGQSEAATLDGGSWNELAKGPALLMIHGTFSTTAAAFGDLPVEFVQELHRRYDGRVFAFDHYTLSHDPIQNGEHFFASLPEDLKATVDVVCHSRGGLVARTIAELQDAINPGSRTVTVRGVIFVATPNNGTILTDGKYMGDFIDSYTNLLTFLPTNGATEILDGVLTVAKELAVGALGGLSGLQAMKAGGDFLTKLNAAGAGSLNYFALASNFDPPQSGLKEWAKNRLMDKIFKAENDLVVPTGGVYEPNGSTYFPIKTKELFKAGDHIPHTGFFRSEKVQDKIMEWLGSFASAPTPT